MSSIFLILVSFLFFDLTFAVEKLPSEVPVFVLDRDRAITSADRTLRWVCGEIANITEISCTEPEKDPFDPFNDRLVMFNLEMIVDGVRHTYALRHAIDQSECRSYLDRWREIKLKSKPVCTLGKLLVAETVAGKDLAFWWTFFEMKSEKITIDDCSECGSQVAD